MGPIFEMLSLEAQRRPFPLRNLLGILRNRSPILTMGSVCIVLSADGVREAYGRPRDFLNAPIFAPKLKLGPMILGMDPSPTYNEERSRLERAAASPAMQERFASLVKESAAARADKLRGKMSGNGVRSLDLVAEFIEPVYVAALCKFFGVDPSDATSRYVVPPNGLGTVTQWLRKLGGGFAASVPAPFGLESLNNALALEMCTFLGTGSAKSDDTTVIDELKDGPLPVDDLVRWVGGMMLAGAALFKATTIVIHELLERPEPHALARGAADSQDIDLIAKLSWEALRFHPLFPLVARYCPRETTLCGSVVPAGATVVLATLSAMFDPTRVERPEEFLPERFAPSYPKPHDSVLPDAIRVATSSESKKAPLPDWFLLFGGGPHRCLAEELARRAVPVVVASILSTFQIERPGKIAYDGTAVAKYEVKIVLRKPVGNNETNRSHSSRPPASGERNIGATPPVGPPGKRAEPAAE